MPVAESKKQVQAWGGGWTSAAEAAFSLRHYGTTKVVP